MPLREALRLAANGIPVFPCYPDGHGLRPDGRAYYKSPRIAGWQIHASTVQSQIEEWWRQWPDSLVAVPTGQRSGLHVLDLDVKPHKGVSGIESLRAAGLVPPKTRINWTLTGGMHLLYLASGDSKTDSNVLGSGIDRRGDGGYIIWWPAHGGSVTYEALVAPPEWMTAGRDDNGLPEDTNPPIGLTDAELHDIMARIQPQRMDSRSEWIEVGMALHHETEGSERGLAIWNAHSMNWPKYDGLASLEREWATFGRSRRIHKSIRSFMPTGWTRLPQEVFAGGMATAMAATAMAAAPQPAPQIQPAVAAATPQIQPAQPFFVPPLPQAMIDARDGTAISRPLSELGNGLRMHDQYRHLTRYVPDTKQWLHWIDGSWAGDPDSSRIRRMAMELSYAIYAEGNVNIHEAMLYSKWARKTQEKRIADNSISAYSMYDDVRVPLSMLDADTMAIGMDDGRKVLDLRTGQVRMARQEDYITKALGVREIGRPDGSPRWLQFVDEVFCGDRELIDWVQRWCGYVLTGRTEEEFFVFAYGAGRNGKGTFSETIKYIMGDYGRIVSKTSLAEARRPAGGASPDIAALAGARFALSSETDANTPMDEGLVKNLTGGDSIVARRLYADGFEFIPQFKLLISGNHRPVIRGDDYGIWSRVRLVPFLRIFTNPDPGLKARFRTEAPHILAWMLQGCLAWQQRGLRDIPAAIQSGTTEYKNEMDVMGVWLDECAIVAPGHQTIATMLYTNYKNWATMNGYKNPMTMQAFGRRLSDRGFNRKRTENGVIWTGIMCRY